MTTDYASRARILDVREERKACRRFECRENASGDYEFTGYAATFTPYDVYGGPERGGWVETLTRNAFDTTLGQKPDVMLLINHEDLPIARTTSGNLDLSVDSHGLLVHAMLDRSDPDVQRIAPKMVPRNGKRPLLDEMSFAFRVKDQVWDADYQNRTITEVSLHKGDVSIVNFGMNPGTRAALQQGVEALQSLSHKELVELRRLDPDLVHRAELALVSMGEEKRGWRANEEHNLNGGVCTTCADAAARAKTPSEYSNVGAFADPGYLDASGNPAKGGNGVKRYPIDEKHVQAAWSYINMPKNQKGYTAEQLASVKSAIKAAMKRFGHEVTEDKAGRRRSTTSKGLPAGVSHYDMVRNAQGGTTMIAVLYDGTRTALPGTPATGLTTGSAPSPGDKRLGGMFPYVWTGAEGRDHDDDDDEHDDDCDGEHDDDEDCNDNDADERAFGGKKAAPFTKGGGREDDDDDDEGRATSTKPGGKLGAGTEDDDDEGRAAAPSAQAELSDYEGTNAKAGAHEDEGKPDNEDEHEVQLSLPKGPIHVERMLHEFRGRAGMPDIRNVSEGLAYLRRA